MDLNYQLPLNSSNDLLVKQNIEAVRKIKLKDIDNNIYLLCVNKFTGEIQAAPDHYDINTHTIVPLNILNSKHVIDDEGFQGLTDGAVQVVKQTLEHFNTSKKRKVDKSGIDVDNELVKEVGPDQKKVTTALIDIKRSIIDCFGESIGKVIVSEVDKVGNLTHELFQGQVAHMIKNIFRSQEPLSMEQLCAIHSILSYSNEIQEFANKDSILANLKNLYECLYSCLIKDNKKIGDLQSVKSIDPQERYLSDVRLLYNAEDIKCWILKKKPELSERDGIKVEQMPKREHVAFLLSEDGSFPVPFTICLNMEGEPVSIQKYVQFDLKLMDFKQVDEESDEELSEDEHPGTVSATEKVPRPPEDEMEITSLQKIMIFDLLFSNLDRHVDNILFQKLPKLFLDQQDEYGAIAIDHGYCMASSSSNTLLIDFLYFFPMTYPVEKELYALFSNESIEKYAQIMEAQGMPKESICWMKSVGYFLQKMHTDENKQEINCKYIALYLKNNYQKIWNDVVNLNDHNRQTYIDSLMPGFYQYAAREQAKDQQ